MNELGVIESCNLEHEELEFFKKVDIKTLKGRARELIGELLLNGVSRSKLLFDIIHALEMKWNNHEVVTRLKIYLDYLRSYCLSIKGLKLTNLMSTTQEKVDNFLEELDELDIKLPRITDFIQ